MPNLSPQLVVDRCPHCSIANPNLHQNYRFSTQDHEAKNQRFWCVYVCKKCGGVVTACARGGYGNPTVQIIPVIVGINEDIPAKAKNYLEQAVASIHAPSGAVMLSASSVDAMLKAKGYKDGSLYERIEKAVKKHLLTPQMADWAHEVRLDANDQRHADEKITDPSNADAKKVVDFTKAIGEYLFVLPGRIKRGIGEKTAKPK